MTDVAQRMARGDYSGRVRATATDEVGRLAVAFNRMAADLEQVDAERRDLLATVSHELRTPLAAMTAVLENLADGVVPADPEHLAERAGPGRAAARPGRRPAGPLAARGRRHPLPREVALGDLVTAACAR